jgi:simple sugar transport system permease protein
LAALGGALCNQAGVLNLALEGKMLLGAFVGILAAFYIGNSYAGLIVAMIAGGLLGLLFAFLYHKYRVDLVILAIAFNLIIVELTVFVMRAQFGNVGSWSDPSIERLPDIEIPLIKDIPFLGPLLSGYNIVVYFSWLVVIVMFIYLYRMKGGRHLRAVGESRAPQRRWASMPFFQTLALVICGALAALGGAFLSIGHLKLFTRNMSNGRGWIAVAAAMFGVNHPVGVFFASLFFGFADAFAVRIQNVTDLPPNLVKLLPNVATLLVLIIIGLRSKIALSMARRRFRAQLRAEESARPTPAEEPAVVLVSLMNAKGSAIPLHPFIRLYREFTVGSSSAANCAKRFAKLVLSRVEVFVAEKIIFPEVYCLRGLNGSL